MNLDGFGERIIEDFYNMGYLQKIDEYYTLECHRQDLKELEDFQASKCVECGMCSYMCPSKIELTDAIKKAKLYLRLNQTKK